MLLWCWEVCCCGVERFVVVVRFGCGLLLRCRVVICGSVFVVFLFILCCCYCYYYVVVWGCCGVVIV